MSVSSRVQAGIALLDKHYPGWVSHINPCTLEIRDGDKCILGQVYYKMLQREQLASGYSGYHNMVNELILTTSTTGGISPWELGFIGRTSDYDTDCMYLEEEWKTIIRARQTGVCMIESGSVIINCDPTELSYEKYREIAS